MRYDPSTGMVISGANSRLSFRLVEGATIEMPEQGIFVGGSARYVLDYYGGLFPSEVLLVFEFDTKDIVSGDPFDREPELGVRKAKLIEWLVLGDWVIEKGKK